MHCVPLLDTVGKEAVVLMRQLCIGLLHISECRGTYAGVSVRETTGDSALSRYSYVTAACR